MNATELQTHLRRLATFATGNPGDTRERLTTICHEIGSRLGFDRFVYALRVPSSFAASEIVHLKGYPEEWLTRYWERSYFAVDPVIAYCTRNILPITWQRLLPDASAIGRRFFGEASEFGLRSGISVPIHDPHGGFGILSLAHDRGTARSRRDDEHALAFAQLFAPYIHEATRRVHGTAIELDRSERSPRGKRPTRPSVRNLSVREEDCLRWAADGKTSWEIAQVLAISERTVNFHFDNSVAKLNAVNRQHAIAIAVALHIVTPRPF